MSIRNPFAELKSLLGPAPLQVGTVTDYSAGTATVQLPDGGSILARGEAGIGESVYVRGGLIEGPAPSLPIVTADV